MLPTAFLRLAMVPIFLLILLVLGTPLAIAIYRSNQLFVLHIVDGHAYFRRGRMPQTLLDEMNDVTQREGVADARITVIVEDGSPRLTGSGYGEGVAQQLRNVIGTYPLARIKAGGRPRLRRGR